MAKKIKITYPPETFKGKLQTAGFVERDNAFVRGDQRVILDGQLIRFFVGNTEVMITTESEDLIKIISHAGVK